MPTPEVRLFDKLKPLVGAGKIIKVAVQQSLLDGADDLLKPIGPGTVEFIVEGPQLRLTPDDVAAVYPAPGSEDSPDEFLPHIALRRRTLPWERVGSQGETAWVALLVLKQSELAFTIGKAGKPGTFVHTTTVAGIEADDPDGHAAITTAANVSGSTTADFVYVTNDEIQRLFPYPSELDLLCHVQRVTHAGGHRDHAIVVANRLPDAGPDGAAQRAETHVAMLVSLERRTDLWTVARKNAPAARAALIVLHHWTFTPSKGGDFEQVVRAIRYRPNGGVLRFGSLPGALRGSASTLSGGFPALVQPDGAFHEPVEHARAGPVVFRGPLRPFEPAPRTAAFAVRAAPEELDGNAGAALHDYTYATAFELGRLLVLADAGVLEDIRGLHPVMPPIELPMQQSQLPPALQKPDWMQNDSWVEQPWEMSQGPMLADGELIPGFEGIDLGGIAGQVGQWGGVLQTTLEPLGTPVAPAVASVDFDKMTAQTLAIQFAAVQTAAQS